MKAKMKRIPMTVTLASLMFISFLTIFTNSDYTKAANEIEPQRSSTATPLRIAVPRQGTPSSSFTPDYWNTQPPTGEETALFLRGKNKQATRLLNFMKERKMLIDQGIPFNPDILLAKNWQEFLKKYHPDFFASNSSVWLANGKMKGAIIADQVFLRKDTILEGDTVILARRLVFEGRNVSIKGPHNISIYTIEGNVTTLPSDGKERLANYISPIGSPAFEAEFFARNKILRAREVVVPARYDFNKDPLNHIKSRLPSPDYKGQRVLSITGMGDGNRALGEGSVKALLPAGFISIDTSGRGNKEWREARLNGNLTSNADGAPGRDGSLPMYPKGTRGYDGQDGTGGGQHGSCINNLVNGVEGEDGHDGGPASDGDDAPNDATDGDDGGTISLTISTAEQNAGHYSAKGGDGGNGQDGAIGGDGGTGGRGKKGGDGTTCGCLVGNGGKSGKGGKGGKAGNGGNGGSAASGGNGGTITITYASHLIAPTGNAARGLKGRPGRSGRPGTEGDSGQGQPSGGSPGPTACGVYGNMGLFGATGPRGDSGSTLLSGNEGSNGEDGTVDIQPFTGGGGGPTYCELYPYLCGGGGNPCTPYYWVYYLSWDGGQTWEYQYSEYAGCW
ncbi:MAG: collagen-like protein [Pyrinomonadaceae bacterium]